MKVGIIGGTGVYIPGVMENEQEYIVKNIWGEANLTCGVYNNCEIVFLPRHGATHNIPPHKINYRANIAALKDAGCDVILASNAVGSLRIEMGTGSFVLPDQFLDFTKMRPGTFYDGADGVVRHIDVTEPYCPQLRQIAQKELCDVNEQVHNGGVYVCTEGPRFETPAEIRMFGRFGGDLVGMTGVPEVVLARELDMRYLSICVVTNLAAGMAGQPLTEGEVSSLMAEKLPVVREVLLQVAVKCNQQSCCDM